VLGTSRERCGGAAAGAAVGVLGTLRVGERGCGRVASVGKGCADAGVGDEEEKCGVLGGARQLPSRLQERVSEKAEVRWAGALLFLSRVPSLPRGC
jgi:hypothetical protein